MKNYRVDIRNRLINTVYRHIHKLLVKKLSDKLRTRIYDDIHGKVFDQVSDKSYVQVRLNIKP